ncbi:MAG: hypothetical protein IPG83_11835 [Novosphingobium sp.]|nr:hypothetical protein [Novosphingobium sp.]
MKQAFWTRSPVLLALVVAIASPAIAQNAGDKAAEARLRKIEAEVKALQRQVFPGGDGKYFPAQVQPAQQAAPTGTPASNPVADLLVRMDALEAQVQRLTAQTEENGNRIARIEARLAGGEPAIAAPAAAAPGPAGAAATAVAAAPAPVPAPVTPTVTNGATTNSNLAAMSGGVSAAPAASVPAPAVAAVPVAAPAAAAAAAAAVTPAAKPAATAPAKPAAAASAAPAKPSPQRLAAVRAIAKPQTADAGDDEYSYGFRLWEAKFYPEAQQQLKLFMEKYPKHARMSYARNLLGRAYLDGGDPTEAASWFYQNYQADKQGDRAPDSLLFLAESMRRREDTRRACIALAQFADDYPREAAGRLKAQYDTTRNGLKCS